MLLIFVAQYFVESDQSGVPFNREKRGMAYQRAKNIDATMPFGTKMDVYSEGTRNAYQQLCVRARAHTTHTHTPHTHTYCQAVLQSPTLECGQWTSYVWPTFMCSQYFHW